MTLLAVLVLWPNGDSDTSDPLLLDADTVGATVTGIDERPCSYSPIDQCRWVVFEVDDAPFTGRIEALARRRVHQ